MVKALLQCSTGGEVMAKAIPVHFLVHNCILKKQTGLDRNRNPIYSKTILKQVRIGARFQLVRSTYGEIKADALSLLIDEENTIYETENGEKAEKNIPVEKDIIEWQGKTFTVRSITPCYTQEENPHHWEVTLE